MVASDGPGEYPVIAEARAGDDAADITLPSGAVAYITTGGEGGSSGGGNVTLSIPLVGFGGRGQHMFTSPHPPLHVSHPQILTLTWQ